MKQKKLMMKKKLKKNKIMQKNGNFKKKEIQKVKEMLIENLLSNERFVLDIYLNSLQKKNDKK
jgi:hypothetical protein